MARHKMLLPLRDRKDGPGKQGKLTESGQKPRSGAEGFFSLSRTERSKPVTPAEILSLESEDTKVQVALRRLQELDPNWTDLTPDTIRGALASEFAAGNTPRAVVYADLMRKSSLGQVLPYNPDVQMVGAVNRKGVTCYLDSLLFAMFARLDAFDCMLKDPFPVDSPQGRLAAVLRFWVNMLRTGNLIHTDLTKLLLDLIVANGWGEAGLVEQQDASEAFGFITQVLQLPLLRMQVDLFHHGLEDESDHRVAHERLLNLAIPSDLDGKGVKLEDCLEEYFNARVDVSRDSTEKSNNIFRQHSTTRVTEAAEAAGSSLSAKNTIRVVTEEGDEEDGEEKKKGNNGKMKDKKENGAWFQSPTSLPPTPPAPLTRVATTPPSFVTDPTSPGIVRPSPHSGSSGGVRQRSASLIQRIVVDEKGRPEKPDPHDATSPRKLSRTNSSIVKAVTMPAWQFFRLIPWHSSATEKPNNDTELAMNLDRRPVVGICLKRYAITAQGSTIRHNTHVDIPESFRLPNFMSANYELDEAENTLFGAGYKLVLQSVVCHRGSSLSSGHYVSYARMAPKILTDNRRLGSDPDPPPDYEEAQWVRFDDLGEPRIAYVDDIRKCLRDEMPYLLFYQVMPSIDAPEFVGDVPPPSYEGSLLANSSLLPIPGPPSPMLPLSAATDYFDRPRPGTTQNPPGLSVASFEADRPPRSAISSPAMSRRSSSVLLPIHAHDTQPPTTTAPSPILVSASMPSDDRTTSSRMSRAAGLGTVLAALTNRSRNPSSSCQCPEEHSPFRKGKACAGSHGGFLRPSREDLGTVAIEGRLSFGELRRSEEGGVWGGGKADKKKREKETPQCLVM